MNKLERNIPLTYIYSILMKRVTMPIIIIYFLLNTLSFTEIAILAAIAAGVGLALEIPAGIFTDKYGKRTVMIFTSTFSFFMMVIYFFGNSFLEFAIASIFLGLWSASTSGTRSALLFDTLAELKRKHDYKQIYGKMILYSHIGNALILLAIPLIYSLDVKLPFLIGIIFSIAIFFLSILIREPKIKTDKNHKIMRSSIKEIFRKKGVLFAIILMMISFASIFAFSEFKQPLLLIASIEVIYFGIIYALIRGISGIGGILPHKIHKKKIGKFIPQFGILLIFISFLFSFTRISYLIIIGILIIALSEGLLRVSLYDTINHLISSANRTTILSIASVLQMVGKIIIVLIMGFLADSIGVTQMFFPITIIFVLAIGITFILFKNQSSTIFT
jgi:predicted MFS family arabinose efflux permease